MRSSASWRDRLAFVLGGLLIALSSVEVALRVQDPATAWRDELVPQQVSELDLHRLSEDEELLYELIPDLDLERQGPFGSYSLRTNSLGFRGPEPAPAGRRILVLGGSNTFGPGVGEDQTWPAVMQRGLPGTEVLNLGVSGYMTRQKAAMARRHMGLQPDLVLLQVYNTGRRFLLNGTTAQAFSRWPALWSEYFQGTGGALWSLASWRTAVIGWNRAHQQEVAEALYEGTVQADLEAVRGLKAELDAAGIPLVLVLPTAGGSLQGMDLPTIDLSAMDPPDTEIHPDAAGHEWAGRRVADALESLFPSAP